MVRKFRSVSHIGKVGDEFIGFVEEIQTNIRRKSESIEDGDVSYYNIGLALPVGGERRLNP
jgi:hypothetical protein